LRQRDSQGGVEKIVGTQSQARGEYQRQRPAAFLHDLDEKDEQEEHRGTVTEPLDGKYREDARSQYRHGMAPFGPADRRQRWGAAGADYDENCEKQKQRRQKHWNVGWTGLTKGSEGEMTTLKNNEKREERKDTG